VHTVSVIAASLPVLAALGAATLGLLAWAGRRSRARRDRARLHRLDHAHDIPGGRSPL
jgi:hypothetical protein